MAFIRFVQWALFLFFLSSESLTSATSCEYNGDCYPPQTCCSDHVCREECNYCSYYSQCGSRECCGNDGKCKTRCSDSICEFPDGVSCREMCDHCSQDYQCGTGGCCTSKGKCKAQCSDGVCRESCSCKTDNDCGINECCDSEGVCKMSCKRFSVVIKVIFPLGSTLAGFLLLVCCYRLYKHCSRKQHRNRTVHPANCMSTTHHSTMIINYQQRDNSDSLTIVEVKQLQRSV